ncbi:uncharacterized protein LOC135226413 [Macrobrachium nipponense]|uniref:uncharacterized protein LOC135226413 n=1 Tax=Macrobrachium nipponense TaxID=159736 RepID=UPI0030C7B6C3
MIVTANGTAEIQNGTPETKAPIDTTSSLVQLMKRCNSFFINGLVSIQGDCRPLIACGRQVGVIRPDVACCLLDYPQVFTPTIDAFIINPQLDSYAARSNAIELVLRDLRAKNALYSLSGWREECFNVWADFGTEPLFKIERSAATVLGIRAYGVHVNGYTRSPDGSMIVWLQKRAIDKPTYPGMMDTMVGGGLTAGLLPSQVLFKEAFEEASIPEHLVRTAKAAGTVSFFVETERGLHANTEFVYDLELPSDFVPSNNDGEVEGFEAIPVEELLDRVTSSKYKLTSVPVAMDFLIRHGFITSDNENQLPVLMELLHVPLNQLYIHWPHTITPTSSPTPPLSDV